MSPSSLLRLDALDDHRELGPLFIRLFAGTFLIYMSQDNVFSQARMLEFERFLATAGFPLVPVAARVSVYAQFIAGILFLLGLFVRPAAAVMVVNFVVAILMVHLSAPFRAALEPSAMLASALALLVMGGGALSVDRWLKQRRDATSRVHASTGPAFRR